MIDELYVDRSEKKCYPTCENVVILKNTESYELFLINV